MPSLNYVVHGATLDETTVDAIVAGKTVQAKVPALTVELVSDCGGMGHTFRFIDFEQAEQKLFATGANIVLSFAAGAK